MKLAIMQPYLFPYVGYFQLIKAVDRFVLYDDVNYINRGWINRNNLLINGKASLFTVPLKEASQNRLISDIRIADETRWREKLTRSIESGYRKAPYYPAVAGLVERVLQTDVSYVADLIRVSLREILAYLQITTHVVPSSTVYGNAHLKAQERILDICRLEQCHTYINPSGGVELYDKARFRAEQKDLYFIKSKPIRYEQFSNEFVPWLSIIDVLMFNPGEKVHQFLDEYELL